MACFLRALACGAQLLVIGQDVGRDVFDALFLEPAGGGVDGELQIGVGQGRVDFLVEFDGHGQRLARTSARCMVRMRGSAA